MSTQTTADIGFDIGGTAEVRGRYALSEARSVTFGDPRKPEIVGVGVQPGKPGAAPHLVYEFGATQASIPMRAVATAMASGTVVPFDLLVQAVAKSGHLDALKKALAAHK